MGFLRTALRTSVGLDEDCFGQGVICLDFVGLLVTSHFLYAHDFLISSKNYYSYSIEKSCNAEYLIEG